MPDLEIATAEANFVFSAGEVVTIGRREDSRVVLTDPTVSRQHAQVRFDGGSWVLEDLTAGRTFYEGFPVSRLALTASPQRIHLVSPDGPALTLVVLQGAEVTGAAYTPPAGGGRDTEANPIAGVGGAYDAGRPIAQMPMGAAPAPSQWAPFRPGSPPAGGTPGFPLGPSGVAPRGGTVDAQQLKRALHILFPYRSWIENAGWRQGVRALFVVYAMLPVVFVVAFFNTTNFQTLGWVYALYTAPLWLLAFWYLIKPEDPKRTLLITGAAVTVIVLLIMAGPLQWYYSVIPDPQKTPGDWFSWLIAPGFAEEATKDGAVLVTLLAAGAFFKERLGFKGRLGVRSCMFLGTVAGLTFGAREAALYQSNDLNLFAGGLGPHAIVQYVLEFSLRIFTDGLQHAEWAGIACFFIGLGLNYTRRRLPLILFGFAFGAIVHATNDWSTGISHWLWLLLQVLSAVLFLGYTLFAPTIEAQVRETSLFRGESILADQMQPDGQPFPPGQPGPPGQGG